VKYSKRVREEAALICAIAASGGVLSPPWRARVVFYSEIEYALSTTGQHAKRLATAAWRYAMSRRPAPWGREHDAEAEALIRTGWSPP
jgi:hypothetical protein